MLGKLIRNKIPWIYFDLKLSAKYTYLQLDLVLGSISFQNEALYEMGRT